MKVKYTFTVIYYSVLIMILHRSSQNFIIISAYILLVVPILDTINTVLGLDFKIHRNKGENFITEETKISKDSYYFEFILLIFSLLIFTLITWYTFTTKISITK
ncbi:hypothetical protein AU378_03625 [Chryseobacterium kwangjuense]|uniref:Uncharacterized protein n=1 Tax=Chryseobacterium kwangjuense TaxID=267125 RepID=A0A135WIW1_9FLAO|nr:hypothetical protein AU378_03625 [Chryseobacterium kwangjuense]